MVWPIGSPARDGELLQYVRLRSELRDGKTRRLLRSELRDWKSRRPLRQELRDGKTRRPLDQLKIDMHAVS